MPGFIDENNATAEFGRKREGRSLVINLMQKCCPYVVIWAAVDNSVCQKFINSLYIITFRVVII